MRRRAPIFAVTTGDPDGIGLEVTMKALRISKILDKANLVIFRSQLKNKTKPLGVRFENIDALEQLHEKSDHRVGRVFELVSSENPAKWVEDCAHACLQKKLHGIVTGPLSKPLVKANFSTDVGHNDLLGRVCKTKSRMAFVGEKFNVVLATGHIPLEKVSAHLTENELAGAISCAAQLRKWLPNSVSKKPIAVLGLNPHAGEEGLLGKAETNLHKPYLKKLGGKYRALGPLVPDAAFLEVNWSKFSVFIANYHDQGLIPFKLVHGQGRAAQISMNLPIVRTSVDHGTAKDIFGKNKADARSMAYAMDWAFRIAQARRLI